MTALPRTRLGTLLISLLATLLLGALLAGAADAKVTGPKRVKPGKVVTFTANNLKPDDTLYVRIEPKKQPPDSASDGAWIYNRDGTLKEYRADSSGRATLRFKFPKKRLLCGATCGEKKRWKKGSTVNVDVYGGSLQKRDARGKTRIKG